jgi:hypothetical protein
MFKQRLFLRLQIWTVLLGLACILKQLSTELHRLFNPPTISEIHDEVSYVQPVDDSKKKKINT